MRKIVDVFEVLDAELHDGVEVYSAFIDGDWAQVLMTKGKSPVAEWQRQNPGKDVDDATAGEVIDAWENHANEPSPAPASASMKRLKNVAAFCWRDQPSLSLRKFTTLRKPSGSLRAWASAKSVAI